MSNLKKILFYYSYSQNFTGGPRGLVNLINLLDRSHFKPIFVSQQESLLTEQLSQQDVEVVIVPFTKILDVYNQGVFSYSLADKISTLKALLEYNDHIANIARQHNIDCIWSRNIKSVLLTGIAAKKLGMPLVWDIGLEKKSRGLMTVLNWIGLNLSQVVITEATCQPKNLFGSLTAQLFAHKFTNLYRGIEPMRIEAIQEAKNSNVVLKERFEILNVGTIHPRKNQLMLLRAIAPLVKQYQNIQVKLVGSVGDKAYFSQLEEFVKAEQLEPYVEFLGWRDDIPELMSRSDLFVLCSHNEGLAYVIPEAMYAELLIISTAVGGVPDIVKHGDTGFLVARDNDTQLGELIEKCITNTNIRQSIVKRAREVAEQKYSIAAFSSEYNTVLRELCKI